MENNYKYIMKWIERHQKLTLLIIMLIIAFGIYIWEDVNSYVKLEPESPNGVYLVAQTTGDMRSSTSTVYIKYPNSNKLFKTGVEFGEDEGSALAKPSNRLSIVWIDSRHVSITFKGRDYDRPITKIVEY